LPFRAARPCRAQEESPRGALDRFQPPRTSLASYRSSVTPRRLPLALGSPARQACATCILLYACCSGSSRRAGSMHGPRYGVSHCSWAALSRRAVVNDQSPAWAAALSAAAMVPGRTGELQGRGDVQSGRRRDSSEGDVPTGVTCSSPPTNRRLPLSTLDGRAGVQACLVLARERVCGVERSERHEQCESRGGAHVERSMGPSRRATSFTCYRSSAAPAQRLLELGSMARHGASGAPCEGLQPRRRPRRKRRNHHTYPRAPEGRACKANKLRGQQAAPTRHWRAAAQEARGARTLACAPVPRGYVGLGRPSRPVMRDTVCGQRENASCSAGAWPFAPAVSLVPSFDDSAGALALACDSAARSARNAATTSGRGRRTGAPAP
jgi:hypothetical protein